MNKIPAVLFCHTKQHRPIQGKRISRTARLNPAEAVPLFNNLNRVTGKPQGSWQNETAPDGIEVSAESVCVR